MWSKIELQTFCNGFLQIKRKETQINVTINVKSSEIYIGESIIKSVDSEKLLGKTSNFIFDDHV